MYFKTYGFSVFDKRRLKVKGWHRILPKASITIEALFVIVLLMASLGFAINRFGNPDVAIAFWSFAVALVLSSPFVFLMLDHLEYLMKCSNDLSISIELDEDDPDLPKMSFYSLSLCKKLETHAKDLKLLLVATVNGTEEEKEMASNLVQESKDRVVEEIYEKARKKKLLPENHLQSIRSQYKKRGAQSRS